MSDQIKTTTIDQLPEATSLDELQVFGYSPKNAVGKRSVKVPIELLKGNKGNDGGTPIIGANGNWWINGVDTGLPARGEKGDSDLADYAKKVRENGDKVVYAKDGQIILDAEHTKYNEHSVKDVLDGIGYVFGVDELPEDKNLFTPDIYVARNSRLEDGTGNLITAQQYAVTTAIPAILPKGTTLTINTNQTVVLHDKNKKVIKVFDSLSTTPLQEKREMLVDIDGVEHFAFTFWWDWGRNTMYAKDNIPILLNGIPARNVRLANGKRLEERIDELSVFQKGADSGKKTRLDMIESLGLIRTDGTIILNDNRGTIATSEVLAKNSYYLIELNEIITGIASGSISGHQISISGKKTTWIKTDNRDNQTLVLAVQATTPTIWDIRNKYKVYKIDEPTILKNIDYSGKLPAMGADLSAMPSVSVPEPQWIIWNIYESYYNLTSDAEYTKTPHVFEYLDSNGYYFQKYATAAAQGKGSMVYENRNMKCKLQNYDGSKFYIKIGDWIPRSSFQFKTNYVDFSQSKNQATANFITDWYRNDNDPTKKTYPWNRGYSFNNQSVNIKSFDNRARGIIASVPCLVSSHWTPRHVATMNLNAFADNFNLDTSNPLHRCYKGGGYLENNIEEWEELCSDTEGSEMSEETIQPLRDFFNWMEENRSSAKIEEFKQGNGVRYDMDDMIDYWLLAEFIFAADSGWMNMIWLSYDSVKFTPMWWDMDTCFGSHWNGTITHLPTEDYKPSAANISWWSALLRAYPTEIKARYQALRKSGRFSVAKIREIYGGYINRFPYEWYEMDFHTWIKRNSIQPGHFSDLNRILWFTENRLNFLDTKYEYLSK